MALVDLDNIHHYRPLRPTGRPLKGGSKDRPTAWKRGASTVSSNHRNSSASLPKNKTSVDLENRKSAGCIDLTTPSPTEAGGDWFGEPALIWRGMETVDDPLSVGLHITAGGAEDDSSFLSIEELLRDTRGTQEQYATSLSSGRERVDGAVDCIDPNHCDGSFISQPNSGGDEFGEAADPSSIHSCGDGWLSNGHSKRHSALCPSLRVASDSDAKTVDLREETHRLTSGLIPMLFPPVYSLPLTSSPPLSPRPIPLEAQPTHIDLSSISENKTGSSGIVFEETESRTFSNREEKAGNDNGQDSDAQHRSRTARKARGLRASLKRPADIADLNEGGEKVPRLKRRRRIDSIEVTDDIDQGISDGEFSQLLALPEPVFKMPPFWRDLRQRENTASSSRSSEAGRTRENPVVVGDDNDHNHDHDHDHHHDHDHDHEDEDEDEDEDDEKPNEGGGSTRATSMETKLGLADPQDSPSEKADICARFYPYAPQPPPEPDGRPSPPNAALPKEPNLPRIGASPLARSSAIPPPPLAEEEEWEIKKIIHKRRTGKHYEYRVRWKDTWLSKSELGNAQRLLREFEARHRAQRGSQVVKTKFDDR